MMMVLIAVIEVTHMPRFKTYCPHMYTVIENNKNDCNMMRFYRKTIWPIDK